MLEEQHENFVTALGKIRNASGQRGENERQPKKMNKNTYDISSIKHVTRKFHVLVVQNNGKEMYTEKYAARAKLLFC